jgi:hypothetical protein
LVFTFILLSLGRYLCWWTIWEHLIFGNYVYFTITGSIPLLVDYLRASDIWYLRLLYYHWVDTSAGGLFESIWWSLFQNSVWSTFLFLFFIIWVFTSSWFKWISSYDKGRHKLTKHCLFNALVVNFIQQSTDIGTISSKPPKCVPPPCTSCT